MTFLTSYWPPREETYRCIKTEAESPSDAVLLAAHQPTPLSIQIAQSDVKTPATEQTLLDAFLTENIPEGTLLLSITGVSGVGKSHMIRWLSAQLGRDPRAQNMHVIRIPKSSNLKTVVNLILAPLEGNPKFAKARTELQHAVSAVNPIDAAVRFAAELKLALKKKADELRSDIQSDKKAPNVRDLKNRLDHAGRLPGCFTDAALQGHFEENVLPKIIERAIKGKVEEDGVDEILPQFSVEDLQLPHDIELGKAAENVRVYYQTVLGREGGNEYGKAVGVLNSVVDSAIRNVFHLNQAMGGVTLESIVLEIRSLLMEEGKELVLLVEDFATLSGIQEILLRVCIKEAFYDGEQVRAPMRTALALTDGYLTGRETILTRAGREWVVESSFSNPEEIITRTIDLTAAYLNAARWGEEKLKKMLRETMKNPSASLTGWVPVFLDETEAPEESNIRVAFGKSSSGVPLFPFNEQAIRSLLENRLRLGGQLKFNPRAIIKQIILFLLDERDAYIKGIFPPAHLSGLTLKADIAQWLSQTNLNGTDQDRLGQLIAYWGANPENRSELGALPEEIFSVFGLPAPTKMGVESRQPLSRDTTQISPTPVSTPVHVDQTDPSPTTTPNDEIESDYIIGWRKTLESWIGGERLNQKAANTIRKVIVTQLNRAIDWNPLCMRPVEAKLSLIQLNNAMGEGGASKNKIPIGDDPQDKSGNLRRTLLAFLRHDHLGQTMSYADADEDTALIANAIDLLIPKHLKIVTENLADDVEALSTALVRQGRILGVTTKKIAGRSSISAAVFAAAPELTPCSHDPQSPKGCWRTLKESSARERSTLQELLKSKVAAYQGSGGTVYAVDVARLRIGNTDNINNLRGLELSGDQREYLSSISNRKLMGLSNLILKDLREVQNRSQHLFGENFEKNQLCSSLKALAVSAEEGAVWPSSFPHKRLAFSNRIDEFQKLAVSDVFNQLSELFQEQNQDDVDNLLHVLGKLDFQVIDAVDDFLRLIVDFTSGTENELKLEEITDEGQDIQSITKSVDNNLKGIISGFHRLCERKNTP